uniref:Ubiquitin-like protease family profile domain-containing protein n=1 Tax=Cucumis melo TaxID=3656 RepID=A0A9I9EJ29_CUCME
MVISIFFEVVAIFLIWGLSCMFFDFHLDLSIDLSIKGLKTWQAKHDLQRDRSTPKWRPVKCPRQLDSVGCGYYVQKYIHEIVHNSSTSITSL